MARIAGGLVGWIVSVTPLIVVNMLGALGVLIWDDAFIASAIALLAGPLLGGLVGGYLAVRPERETRSGARAAALAGGLVAALYFISVLGLVVFALRPEAIPATLQEHPLRSALAVLALAIFSLSAVGVAFVLGAWFDRHTYQVAYESYTAKMRAVNAQKAPTASRPATPASRPLGPSESHGSSLRDWRDRAQESAQRGYERGYEGYPSGQRREDDAAPHREPWRSR